MADVERGVDAVLLGTYEPKLNDRGRLTPSVEFRDQLQRGLIITRGQEHCLLVLTIEELEEFQMKLCQAPLTSKGARDYQRVFFFGANNQVSDKQGWAPIPSDLRKYAGLERDLTMIGSRSRIEIWDLMAWSEYLNTQEVAFTDREDEVISGLF